MPIGRDPAQPQNGALAELFWPSTDGSQVTDLFRFALLTLVGTAVLIVSAKIKVQFWPVPMTLQTLAVLALGAAFGMRAAVAAVVLYLVQGALGLPVFANTPPALPGPLYFLGPTGGFLAGFVAAAAIVGFAADRGLTRRPLLFAAAVLLGDVVLFTFGWLWLGLFAALPNGSVGIGLEKAFLAGVQPFMLGEFVKIALLVCGVPAIWRLVGSRAA